MRLEPTHGSTVSDAADAAQLARISMLQHAPSVKETEDGK